MNIVKSILVPTDFSERSDAALKYAVDMAQAFGAQISLIHVPGEVGITSSARPFPVTVLKVPHHGSATSSGEAFLRWAKPALAVFSLGAGNAYGFPHPSVLARYRHFGARILRTDREGSVWISIEGGRVALLPQSAAFPALCSLFGALR